MVHANAAQRMKHVSDSVRGRLECVAFITELCISPYTPPTKVSASLQVTTWLLRGTGHKLHRWTPVEQLPPSATQRRPSG